jgi:streptomycin 6-kinase
MTMPPPDALTRNVTHVLGDQGRAWIDALPSLIDAVARDYALTIGPPFELSYNYVAPVTLADGTDAVLKLSPHGAEFRHELTAMRHFDGKGMARLLAADDDRGVALLERLRPGTMLVDRDDDERQTEIAAAVMLELRRTPPAGSGLPTTRDWFEAFARHRSEHGGAGPLPQDIFERGEATYRSLLDSAPAPVLLHGDLHHYNILSAQRAPWLSIDPHGVIGDPVFEVGAWFGNPSDVLSRANGERIMRRRIEIFSDRLGFDRQRIAAWGFAYQVLSAVWSAENGGTGWHNAVGVAAILARMQ